MKAKIITAIALAMVNSAYGLTVMVTSAMDAGEGTLRKAIEFTNQSKGVDTIVFNTPSPSIIQLNSPLPFITDPVVINGYTQPNSLPDNPLVELLGGTLEFHVGAEGSVVSGITVPRGIVMDFTQVNAIAGLANVSTRGFVGTGGQVMIGGFITGSPTKILVRALGPTLNQLGVAGTLSDPVLELYDASGVLIASNDSWTDDQANIQATGLAPIYASEPAIIVNRPATSTTAIVRGKNKATGTALVEVYVLQ